MTCALTFDVDWAPDWCIADCADLCRKYGVPATFFVTHRSAILADLLREPRFEIGIHPNFLPGSSHGDSTEAVFDFNLGLVPAARAMRTHALVQSSPLLSYVADTVHQIETDVSLLLPLHPSLRPTDIYLGSSNRRLTRLPYFWEDDVFAAWPDWDWQTVPQSDGLRIFDFHPVCLALNMRSIAGYRALKQQLVPRPLFEATRGDLRPFVNRGAGDRTFLEHLLEMTPSEGFCTVSQITARHRNGAA